MLRKPENPMEAAELFAGWEDTPIWSALQGILGQVYLSESGASGAITAGDFCFFAGEPDRELAELLSGCAFEIAVPRDASWGRLLEQVHGTHASLRMRYAIRKEPEVFDREALTKIRGSLPEGFALHRIDRELYDRAGSEPWSRDLVSQYPDYKCYERLGLGFVVLEGERIVSGASSYGTYRGGIEIEIDTHRDYRRRGLALCCSAALILECLDRGLYPSWDAQNVGSVRLAEKLGYHFSHAYPVYEIRYGPKK